MMSKSDAALLREIPGMVRINTSDGLHVLASAQFVRILSVPPGCTIGSDNKQVNYDPVSMSLKCVGANAIINNGNASVASLGGPVLWETFFVRYPDETRRTFKEAMLSPDGKKEEEEVREAEGSNTARKVQELQERNQKLATELRREKEINDKLIGVNRRLLQFMEERLVVRRKVFQQEVDERNALLDTEKAGFRQFMVENESICDKLMQ